jgi:hypothetical protein
MKIREKIIFFIDRHFIKTDYGNRLPSWLVWLFYPIDMYFAHKAKFYYNPLLNTVRVHGIEFSISFLENIKENRNEYLYKFSYENNIIKLTEVKIDN